MKSLGIPELALLALLLLVLIGLVAFPSAMILRRIGRPWWLGLLALVPILNIALLWFVAVARWQVVASDRRAA